MPAVLTPFRLVMFGSAAALSLWVLVGMLAPTALVTTSLHLDGNRLEAMTVNNRAPVTMGVSRFPNVERRVDGGWEPAPGGEAFGHSDMPMSWPLVGSQTRGFWWLDNPLPSGEYRILLEVHPRGDVLPDEDGVKVVTFEID